MSGEAQAFNKQVISEIAAAAELSQPYHVKICREDGTAALPSRGEVCMNGSPPPRPTALDAPGDGAGGPAAEASRPPHPFLPPLNARVPPLPALLRPAASAPSGRPVPPPRLCGPISSRVGLRARVSGMLAAAPYLRGPR